MHPFVAPFAILAAVNVAILIAAAWLRASVARDRPLAFHALAVWSLVVLLANLGNVWDWPAGAILVSVPATLALFVGAFSGIMSPPGLRSALLAQRREMIWLFLLLAIQVVLYLVPLLTVFPTRTLITGNFVCNDSVAHAVLMRGFETLHGEFGAWRYLGYYPAGFHAVVFALSRLFPVSDAPYFLLPTTIWASSFLGLSIAMLLAGERVGRGVALLVGVSPAAAFLLGTSVYLYFIGHMAVLPLIVGATVILSSWSADDFRGRAAFLALAPAAASVAVYGLVSVSLLAFAVVVRMGLWRLDREPLAPAARAWGRSLRAPGAWIGAAALTALAWPAIVEIFRGFSFFAAQASSVGNLPGGFLSPFHVTGFWKGGAEYRAALTGADSFAAMILAAVLAIEAGLVARARLSRATVITVITFAVPVVATAVLGSSPYVNFKYLCLLTGVWVPLSLLGLARQVGAAVGRRTWPVHATVAITLAAMVGLPVRSFELLPALSEQWFVSLAAIRTEHFARGPVLVLSREDWFQYYRDANDILPLTLYFQQAYSGQPMREVMVDTGSQQEAVAYLNAHLAGAGNRLGGCQGETIGGRFRFYWFACLTSPP